MKSFNVRILQIFLLALLLLQPVAALSQSAATPDEPYSPQTDPDYGTPYWTLWDSSLYSLASEDKYVWIGGMGNVVRWEKDSSQYTRMSIPGLLPNQPVLAAVVDSVGNRWFGSENGLFRLDTGNQWTHFTTANSGLQSNYVNGLTAGANGIIWAIHGGPISRRDALGNWRWYPSNTVAVTLDYTDVLQTQSFSPLWEVAGDEVWTGLFAYNGSEWQDRSPTGVEYSLSYIVADKNQNILGLCSSVCGVAKWNGSGWDASAGFGNNMTVYRLSSAPNSDIWADGLVYGPYGNPSSFVANVTGAGDSIHLGPTSIAMVLPHPNGAWAVGTGLFYTSEDGTSYSLGAPRYQTLTDILVDQDRLLWLHSFQQANWPVGAMQLLDDNATAVVEDDSWRIVDNALAQAAELDGFELSPNGDVWSAWYTRTRYPPFSSSITRRHQGEWIDYTKAITGHLIRVTDIFAQDESHIWFAYRELENYGAPPIKGILRLDDRGTPTDLTDDIWTDYPVSEEGTDGSVAIDSQGQTWYGNSTGLYRYADSHWQSIWQCSISDLAATADGTVYAASSCDNAPQQILAVATDDSTSQFAIEDLVAARFAALRTANRNHLWTVAPSEAIWYAKGNQLFRRNDQGLQSFDTPTHEEGISAIEVDINNHVWVIYQSSLWRMSAKPDFRLDPHYWLVAPGNAYRRWLQVGNSEGFSQPVKLEISGLPDGINATFDTDSVVAGSSVALTVTAAPTVTLGIYSASLIGVSNEVTHTATLTLSVVSQLFDIHLPLISR